MLERELEPEAWPEAVTEACRRLKELDFEVLLDALPDPEPESDASAPDVARSRRGSGSSGDGLLGRGDAIVFAACTLMKSCSPTRSPSAE